MAKKKNNQKKILKKLRSNHQRENESKVIDFNSWIQQNAGETSPENIDNLEELLQKAIEEYNSSFEDGLTQEQRDFYDALEIENPVKKLQALKKLRKKYPDNLRIQGYLFYERREEFFYDDFQEARDIQTKAMALWAKEDYAPWGWLDSREPLRALYSVVIYYLEMNFLSQAAELVDFILVKLKDDFPGMFVYPMMAVYTMLYRHEDMVQLHAHQKSLGWEDDGVMAYLVVSYLLQGDVKAAESVFEELAALNPSTIEVFGQDYWNVGLHKGKDYEYYHPNSEESLLFALSFLSRFLIDKRKMAFELIEIVEAYVERQPDSPTKRKEFFNSPFMKGIRPQEGNALCDNDIMSLQDLEQRTETEILAFPGIGKNTIKKLKENGVVFRTDL